MMGPVAGYWHQNGLDIYRYVNKKPVKDVSGSLNDLKPLGGIFQKKFLIVSRERLLHTRKRYPPAPLEKLKRAVALEIGEMFPIPKPAFHLRVHESAPTYTSLDIWAWESESYDLLRRVFPFQYVIPEDLACFSGLPEMKVYSHREMVHFLAHSGSRFLGSASFPDSNLDERDVERFLSGLGNDRTEIKRIRVYEPVKLRLKGLGGREVLSVPLEEPLPWLNGLLNLNFREFKTRKEFRLLPGKGQIGRLILYLLLGYGVMLYLNGMYYDQAIEEVRQKIKALDPKASYREGGKAVEDFSDVIGEVNQRLKARPSPLKMMDLIATRLPPGSLITRMVLNENNLEVSASSKDPLSVVKALGSAEGIKATRLRGAPTKDIVTGLYNFVMVMELSR